MIFTFFTGFSRTFGLKSRTNHGFSREHMRADSRNLEQTRNVEQTRNLGQMAWQSSNVATLKKCLAYASYDSSKIRKTSPCTLEKHLGNVSETLNFQCFLDVLLRFRDVSETFPRRFRDVSETFPRPFRDVSETFPRRFRDVFQACVWMCSGFFELT